MPWRTAWSGWWASCCWKGEAVVIVGGTCWTWGWTAAAHGRKRATAGAAPTCTWGEPPPTVIPCTCGIDGETGAMLMQHGVL